MDEDFSDLEVDYSLRARLKLDGHSFYKESRIRLCNPSYWVANQRFGVNYSKSSVDPNEADGMKYAMCL
jgi:hypothetical protein